MIEPGLLTTVQDAGRPEAARWGVPSGGACDRWSLAAANALAGNAPTAAALEMTMRGAMFAAQADCLVGIAGAEMGATISETGQRVATGSAIVVRAGQTLRFDAANDGLRTYLALAGGIDVPVVLGSASTCLVGGFGGIDGRGLRAGDRLRPLDDDRLTAGRFAGPPVLRGHQLRVVRGPHVELLGEAAVAELLGRDWQVGVRGDRQGIVLDGAPVALPPMPPMLSEGVVWGAIQLPPDGRPICLLADHNTVGGYPVAAVVIAADLPLLGQLAPTDALRFAEVSLDEARDALADRRRALDVAIGARGGR